MNKNISTIIEKPTITSILGFTSVFQYRAIVAYVAYLAAHGASHRVKSNGDGIL